MSNEEALSEKLDVLIRLQAAALIRDLSTQKEKIAFLSQAGLRPSVIADLLSTSPNSVSVALSAMKKEGKASVKGK